MADRVKSGNSRAQSSGGGKHVYSRLMPQTKHTFSTASKTQKDAASSDSLATNIRILGEDRLFTGPFGERKFTYCDYTASGKPVAEIEDFIRQVVLPQYANTHTTTSTSAHQMTLLRHEARLLIKHLTHAGVSNGIHKDCLVFHGSGSTGGINAVVQLMGLNAPPASGSPDCAVFVGPWEHHSNLLPWRESPRCVVITIGMTPDGNVDTAELERQLIAHASFPLRIGAFSAASNVTGRLVDTSAINMLLHRHGALAFWDFATAGPYVKIDMNPSSLDSENYMDAVFLSPHKFLGGPGSPGLFIIKKRLIDPNLPLEPGGGTVFFVRDEAQRYLKRAEERLEGGTPDIVGSIRAALAFRLKDAIGDEWIMQREMRLRQTGLERLSKVREIILLNPDRAELIHYNNKAAEGASGNVHLNLPIFSFVVQHASGRMVHFNFICTLLNDLFGIQLRGGCMCAGPFSERLLGMSQELAAEFETALVVHDDNEILRPGFCRFSLHYTMSDATVDFVLRAVEWVAVHGWRLMPEYAFERSTGEWYHPITRKFPGRRWLQDLSFDGGAPSFDPGERVAGPDHNVEAYFAQAEEAARQAVERAQKGEKRAHLTLVEGTERLRWFVTPQEVTLLLQRSGAAAAEAGVWDLRNCPLRTMFFVGEGGPADTASVASKASDGAATSASPFQDDDEGFFGALEEGVDDDDDDNVSALASNVKRPAGFVSVSVATAEESSSRGAGGGGDEDPVGDEDNGGVCMIRPPEMREHIDVTSVLSKDAPLLKGVKWHVPPKKKIWQRVRKAIFDFDMIRPGDKVLVCVSGGKDSLSLLHTLHFLQSRLGGENSFELGAVTVDPMTVSFDPRPLIPYMAALGVPYHYEQQPLIDAAKDANASSICSWCSRMKRGIIYSTARKHGYNVVAMGQHLDDLAEAFMMSFWLNGKLRTQKACYVVDEGDLRFCRPLVYVREKDLKEFALEKHLPVISETCPACFAEPKERARVKALLDNQETIYPNMFYSMCAAMDPLMRALPITAEDHERKKEHDAKQGIYDRTLPKVLAKAVWIGLGVFVGCVLFGKTSE